jgi:hypothetical protein
VTLATFGTVRDPGQMLSPTRALENLSRDEALRLLGTAPMARAVFVTGALPTVVPITAAVHDDAVVFRTSSGTRLARLVVGGVLTIEADEVDPATRTGWSVLVSGIVEQIVDPEEQALVHGLVEPWAPGTHDIYLRVPATAVTGRRVLAD